MSSDVPPVVRLANELARNFEVLPPAEASAGLARHIRTFWEPRMRHDLLARIAAGQSALHPLVVAAARDLLPTVDPRPSGR
ncbi:formate dehydrogenase subunit delta [Nostocoides sp.]|uniref:formate dehydrogenase subunit delta n=1 Tax=Nostocoides sp. TaxID=1917966 RepID=UPI002B817EC1|nr:formate dehydrogenase subunit delta [Tetrasphaera sp.]